MSGFGLLDIRVEGFILGSPFVDALNPGGNCDYFVQAPGGGHAGLVWLQTHRGGYLHECGCGGFDWGCWQVGTAYPIDGPDAARRLLAEVLPTMRGAVQIDTTG